MALHDYLTGEVAEDWIDGLITRREAMRRLVLLGLSVPSAGAFLAACASQSTTPAPSTGSAPSAVPATSPATTGTPAPTATAGAGTASAATSGSAGPSPAGGGAIVFPGPRGELQAFFAPASTPRGGMLVIHENRGLTDHIRSVATRLAGDGYSSLAIDLVSEEGGTDKLADEGSVSSILGGASEERLVGDLRAGVDELATRLPGMKLGVIGFCFGGGMTWTLLDAGEPRLAAACPFYGPAPSQPDFSGNTAAVLGVYAENDARVNASRDAATAGLVAAGLTHEINTYPGAEHGFFNDTGARHNATQAAVAYQDVLDWLAQHLGS